MRHPIQPRRFLLVAMGMALTGATLSAEPQDRLTPGAVVLLASSQEPAATETLRRALADSDPDVRRAAARVASVAHPEVFEALMDALRVEQNEAVAVEFTKDAIALVKAKGLPLVEPHARRVGAPAMFEIAEWCARMDPDRFVAGLPTWAALDEPASIRLPELVALAAMRHPTSRDRLLRAWMAHATDGGWALVLARTFSATDAHDARDALLRDALSSDRRSVRTETVWFVARVLSLKGPIAPSVVSAAANLSSDGNPWTAFGAELVGRMASKKTAEPQVDVLRREGDRHVEDLQVAWTSERLTSAEKSVVRDLRGNFRTEKLVNREATMRTPDRFAAFLLKSTMAAAGCRASDTVISYAIITFVADGRPTTIDLRAPALSPACQTLLASIARISTAAPQDVAFEPQALAVPLSASFASCAAGVDPYVPLVRIDAGSKDVESPRLLKEVKPDYSKEGLAKRLQGVVELEAVVSPSGCIASVRVTRSLSELDPQALKAVVLWRFSPARANGKPVPVIVNIELTFTLGRTS